MVKNKGFFISEQDFLQLLNEFAQQKDNSYNPINLIAKELNPANRQTRFTLKINSHTISLDAYFRSDNTITVFSINSEPSKSFTDEFTDYIKDHVKFMNVDKGSFICEDIEKEVFNEMKAYLLGLEGVKAVRDEDLDLNGWIFQLISQVGDKVTLTYYESTKKLCFNGLLMNLHIEIKAFLSGYNAYAETTRQVGDADDDNKINALINLYLKNSYKNLHSLLQDFLYDALKYTIVRVTFKDYGTWAFPALKALEGRIKQMFHFGGVTIDRNGFKDMFDKPGHQYELNSIYTAQVGNNIADRINKCYTYYNKNRHALFHTDQLMSATRRLATQDEAENIIIETCKLIEVSYNDLGR
ncbi:MAG: RNase LS family HEPN domain-containing protein [Clostridiales bacterium]|nr:RNase LS family HEPN domain-containing protein [Clostridiales bacterium]